MLSFNNKRIDELSSKELSTQIYTLSNFYKSNQIKSEYVIMTLSIAELLENNDTDFDFNLKTFIKFLDDTNFSNFEKNLVLEGYHFYLNKNLLKNKNENVISYYYSLINLIESKKIFIQYKSLSNQHNQSNEKIFSCITEINNKIEELESYKEKQKIPALNRIINLALQDLYLCKDIDCFI